MDLLFSIMGMIGSVCGVSMYFLLEQDKVTENQYVYYIVNGIGAVLVLIAVNHAFDIGDIGASLQELCWALISIIGTYRVFKMRKGDS
jgi:hypothetical protein